MSKRKDLTLKNVTGVGLNVDTPADKLPPEAFTSATNISFDDGYVKSVFGYEKIAELPNQTEIPYFVIPYETQGSYFWVVVTNTKVWSYDGAAWVDISEVGFPMAVNEFTKVTGVVMGDVLIINDGVTPPRYWDDPTGGGKMKVLPFDATNSWRDLNITCKVMRVYKQFLVALYPNEDGTSYPQRVWWSDAAPPGTVPTTWDYTLPNNLSGYMEIAETPGYIVDAAQLGQSLIVYKNSSVFAMTFSGGSRVHNFRVLNRKLGAITTNCIAEVLGRHIILSDGDIMATDGQSSQSIISNRVRKTLFDAISPDDYNNSFVTHNPVEKNVWFCVPTQGEQYPSSAVIWNYKNDTFSERDIAPNTTHMSYGIIISGLETFDGPPYNVFDEQIGPYGSRSYSSVNDYVVGCTAHLDITSPLSTRQISTLSTSRAGLGDNTDRLIVYGRSKSAEGEDIKCYLERIGLPIDGYSKEVTVLEIYPHLDTDGDVTFHIGTQDTPENAITWQGPFFVQKGTRKFEPRVTGTLISWRIESSISTTWKLSGMTVEYASRGKR